MKDSIVGLSNKIFLRSRGPSLGLPLALLLALAMGLPSFAQSEGASAVVLIVNAKNKVGELKPEQARQYFLGELIAWPNGERVRLVDHLESDTARKTFLKKILAMTNDDLQRFWVKKRYNDGSPPPPRLATENDVLQYVAAFPGGLGYVSAETFRALKTDAVIVVATAKP
jgi:ABC-type phosphate transport system substrate-binding protein